MRNPNGYGGIAKLGGKRRKPFMVRVTTGWEVVDENTGKLRQLYETLGYYRTRPEALIALAEYNKSPYSLDSLVVTFADIYERWSKRKFTKASKSSIASYSAAFKESTPLHNMKFKDIKKNHMQSIIDNSKNGVDSLNNVKLLFRQLFKYAIENDIIGKDYSEFVEISVERSKSPRTIFTSKERSTLWDNVDKFEYVDTLLIMIYSGLRPGELLDLETENITFEKRIMRGGLKTEAGKNRVIPLNKKILPFIVKRKAEGHKYLLHVNGNKMDYNHFSKHIWKPLMGHFDMDHRPHDCRHTFASMMDKVGANKVCIKRIMGHAIKDITDNVYTHKDESDLLEAIDLI